MCIQIKILCKILLSDHDSHHYTEFYFKLVKKTYTLAIVSQLQTISLQEKTYKQTNKQTKKTFGTFLLRFLPCLTLCLVYVSLVCILESI